MDLYWEAVKQKICRKCIDGDMKGNCRLPVGDLCPLEAFFPAIVATVTGIQSNSYDDYVDALRAKVCAQCEHQPLKGECNKRNRLECALDRYYPLVVEAVESVKYILREEPAG